MAFHVATGKDFKKWIVVYFMHLRFDETQRMPCCCINRDVVGAVVESQPFGGHGLSGNGVKAGSEGYLEQFVAHKVICEDTTAAGGNVELMRTTT